MVVLVRKRVEKTAGNPAIDYSRQLKGLGKAVSDNQLQES